VRPDCDRRWSANWLGGVNTVGIGAGFISYVVLEIALGRASAVHPLLWIVSGLFVVYFAIDPITNWLT
jgi:adenine/guanine/hypoxanthine permease